MEPETLLNSGLPDISTHRVAYFFIQYTKVTYPSLLEGETINFFTHEQLIELAKNLIADYPLEKIENFKNRGLMIKNDKPIRRLNNIDNYENEKEIIKRRLIPKSHFEWILGENKDDMRALLFVLMQLKQKYEYELNYIDIDITSQSDLFDKILYEFDTNENVGSLRLPAYSSSIEPNFDNDLTHQKLNYLTTLKQLWQILSNKCRYRFLTGKPEQTQWIVDYLAKRNISAPFQCRYTSHNGQLNYIKLVLDSLYDFGLVSIAPNATQSTIIRELQNSWKQKQYRDKKKGKVSRNYWLDKDTVKKLEKMSERQKIPKQELLELLIENAYKKQTEQ